jgi:hypothetical protein
VHGIALHVLGDDLSLLARQRDDAAPNALTLFADTHPNLEFLALLDGFNEQWVTTARFLGPRLTIELLRLTGEWTDTFYSSVDLTSVGEPVGFFNRADCSPYWQIVGREYVERWAHHHQIRRALGMGAVDVRFLAPAIDVLVRAIAALMPACGADLDQRVTFDVDGIGTWTLTRRPDRWELVDGTATECFRLDVDEASLLFSRAVPPVEVPRILRAPANQSMAAIATWLAQFLGRP